MTLYTETQIEQLYSSNYKTAIRKLTQLPVYCGTKPAFGQLSGWVYEQTIQYCIRRELKARKVEAEITEHDNLRGRAKVDLKVNNVAIEIKNAGLFSGEDADKYGEYRKVARAKGWQYLFVTRQEGHRPFRSGIANALGRQNVFYLDAVGDWNRFVHRLVKLTCKIGRP